jgi:membrane fusion protein, heavy metal efflux system
MKTLFLTYALIMPMACFLAGCSARSDDQKPMPSLEGERASSEVRISAATARDLGLVVMEAKRKIVQTSLSIPAHLAPNQDREAIVGSLVQGRVNCVLVNAGDRVSKGQQLMLLEGLEIGEIKAAFIKAKAHLRYAEATAKRQRVLNEQNIGSDKALLEAEAELQNARAGFTAEDRKIHSVGLTDKDVERFVEDNGDSASSHIGGLLPIRAPLSGVVAERNVVQGQLVDATTNAFRIIDTDVLWADGQLHERDFDAKVTGGPATLTVTALPGREFKGNIVFVSPMVDAQTRTVTVRAAIPNAAKMLKPNMFGQMQIPTARDTVAILVPAEALVTIGNSDIVFVQTSDSTFEKRSIVVGATHSLAVEVKNGLKEHERIVVQGSFYLKSELLKAQLEEGE